jgi:hypothetical protein
VDKHAEAGFAPPLHAGIALGWSLSILNGLDRMLNRLRVGLAALQLGVTQRTGGDEYDGSDGTVN